MTIVEFSSTVDLLILRRLTAHRQHGRHKRKLLKKGKRKNISRIITSCELLRRVDNEIYIERSLDLEIAKILKTVRAALRSPLPSPRPSHRRSGIMASS